MFSKKKKKSFLACNQIWLNLFVDHHRHSVTGRTSLFLSNCKALPSIGIAKPLFFFSSFFLAKI
jgi:hypothetical protein